MSTPLRGRTAVVTGAGGGIGRGVALAFAEAGSAVVVADIDERAATATAETIGAAGGTAVSVGVDVADEGSVAAAFAQARARAGAIDTLVNVAGVWAGGSVTEISVTDWDRTMAVNTRGPFLCARAVLPEMVQRRVGVIVNIASTAAFKGTRRAGAYNASKAALIGLTKNLALDYAEYGIRAVAIGPGLIGGTDMERQLRRFRGDTDDYERFAVSMHPLGRLGTPEDVAGAAVFLASDQASWMTGSCLLVDGGTMTGF
ncbi:MAG: SDR family NAD(P)-dependent oxidoreductase [Egibacteraceae bacterium]